LDAGEAALKAVARPKWLAWLRASFPRRTFANAAAIALSRALGDRTLVDGVTKALRQDGRVVQYRFADCVQSPFPAALAPDLMLAPLLDSVVDMARLTIDGGEVGAGRLRRRFPGELRWQPRRREDDLHSTEQPRR
jgi:hypothetical protein